MGRIRGIRSFLFGNNEQMYWQVYWTLKVVHYGCKQEMSGARHRI